MEALEEDLSKHTYGNILPLWHGDILAKRDSRVAEGKEVIYGWDEAKERIRRSVE